VGVSVGVLEGCDVGLKNGSLVGTQVGAHEGTACAAPVDGAAVGSEVGENEDAACAAFVVVSKDDPKIDCVDGMLVGTYVGLVEGNVVGI